MAVPAARHKGNITRQWRGTIGRDWMPGTDNKGLERPQISPRDTNGPRFGLEMAESSTTDLRQRHSPNPVRRPGRIGAGGSCRGYFYRITVEISQCKANESAGWCRNLLPIRGTPWDSLQPKANGDRTAPNHSFGALGGLSVSAATPRSFSLFTTCFN